MFQGLSAGGLFGLFQKCRGYWCYNMQLCLGFTENGTEKIEYIVSGRSATTAEYHTLKEVQGLFNKMASELFNYIYTVFVLTAFAKWLTIIEHMKKNEKTNRNSKYF